MRNRAGGAAAGRRSSRVAALALACAGVVAAVAAQPAAAACGPRGSGVVNVSNTVSAGEGEESLSVNPLNPQDLLVGSNQVQATLGSSQLPSSEGALQDTVWASHDGGCTWAGGQNIDPGGIGNVGNPAPASGLPPEFADVGNVITADQHTAWDRHGNVYFDDGQIGDPRSGGDERVNVFHSNDQGRSWSGPVVAYSTTLSPAPRGSAYAAGQEPLDRPWLAVDNSGGPRDGTVYMTFETSPFSEGFPPEVYVTSSSDHGRTWRPANRVDAGTYNTQFNPRQFPSVGADGALYVMYDIAPPTVTVVPKGQVGTIKIGIARSTDGGQTFQRTIVDGNVHRIESPDEALPAYVETIPALAADPSNPGRLAVAWPEALSQSNSRVILRTSSDGGKTWSPRVDVADDPAGSDDQHDHVALTYAPGGRLIVAWRDRRNSGGAFGANFDIWGRDLRPDSRGVAHPGGVVRFTAAPQPTTTGKRGGQGIPAEFIGLAASGQSVMASWDQIAGSYPDNFFRRLPLSAFGGATSGHGHAKRRHHHRVRHRRRHHRSAARFTG